MAEVKKAYRFFLSFPSKLNADSAVQSLTHQKFEASLSEEPSSSRWTCVATRTVDRSEIPMHKVHAYLYTLADACDGTYFKHVLIDDNEE